MVDVETSDIFDDTDGQVAQLEARIALAREEMRAADPDRRSELGWFVFGAHKHISRLKEAAALRRRGAHRFVIHEMEGRRIWAVCTCGARFPGQMHEDFTLEEFPDLPGHVRGSA